MVESILADWETILSQTRYDRYLQRVQRLASNVAEVILDL